MQHQVACVLAFLAAFAITALLMHMARTTLWPDVFPGCVYVDEQGQRYTYVREIVPAKTDVENDLGHGQPHE